MSQFDAKKSNVLCPELTYDGFSQSARKMMLSMITALIPIYFLNAFYYGISIIFNCLLAMLMCFFLDHICYRLRKISKNKGDHSALLTGMIFVLLLPANVPFFVIASGCFVAICVAKHPFGGFGKNAFNPAAVAFCFVAVCWKDIVLSYPEPFTHFSSNIQHITSAVKGISASLAMNSTPNAAFFDIILGQYAGPLAATSVLLLLACGLFLSITKTINWKIPLLCILTCSIFALLFPRASVTRLQSVFYELTSGFIVFGSVFMATDPVNTPRKVTSQVLYGIILGILTMLLRYFGMYELGFCFALVIVNSITATIDICADNIRLFIGKAEDGTKVIAKRLMSTKKSTIDYNENYYILPPDQAIAQSQKPVVYNVEEDIDFSNLQVNSELEKPNHSDNKKEDDCDE